MRFIIDPRSIPGGDEYKLDAMPVTRSRKVVFREIYTAPGAYSMYGPITISAKRKIKGGEELFTDYGADKNFE